jgi:hypothetical protein
MSAENPQFKKIIRPGIINGSIIIETQGEADKTLKNPVKEKYIPAYMLENLRSLAVRAEAGSEDTAGQLWLKEELDKLRKKYPEEQPEEVWRRTLATLMRGGMDTESVAAALLVTNANFYTKMSLGEMTDTEKNGRMENLKDEILKYWPSSPNLA